MISMKCYSRYLMVVLLVGFWMGSCKTENKPPADAPKEVQPNWPTKGWTYADGPLALSFSKAIESFPGNYSLLVVQDGSIVFDHYQAPYAKDSLIHINSCTKTLIALLFGAVFETDFGQQENQPIPAFFPEYAIEDPKMHDIQVRHLLSMNSGLRWEGGIDANDVIQMSETEDWARYVFARDIMEPPGTTFHYNSGGSQVVATLLHRQTPEGLLAYAQKQLFEPMGISNYEWDLTPKGIPKAGWGLHMKMEDLAKLGYLVVNKGQWGSDQLVPAAWITQMYANPIPANNTYDYGYQVWLPKALGTEVILFRGSYPPSTKIVAVIPEFNAVMVYVGENYNTNDLLREHIIPILRGEKAPMDSP